ncbi:MAG: hypothetical protein HYY97_02275 [Rhodocyclales bacterium]|nr:hypothetical protein [Rhodocyclales bacterium]
MENQFFSRPILNSPYVYPLRRWGLDATGQPTQKVVETRRRAEFITPIPKPKKQKAAQEQDFLLFDEGLSSQGQEYARTAIINGVRREVDTWRGLPNRSDWRVTPEAAQLLWRWRHHHWHRLLVHRHRLQRGKLHRPPRLLPRRQRFLQGAEDHAQGRDQRRRLGHAEQRHFAVLRQIDPAAHCGEGHQSSGG